MVISINNVRKSNGASTFSIALSAFLAEATDLSILLIDTNFVFSDIDDIFGIESERGIDDIIDLAINDKLSEGIFRDVVVKLSSLNVITGTKVTQYNRFETEDINYEKIIDMAESLYDVVIIDSPPKKLEYYLDNRDKNRAYLDMRLVKQNFLDLNRYKNSKEYNNPNSLLVINQYVEGRKFNKRAVIDEYNVTVPVFVARYSDKLYRYFNEQKIDIYLLNEKDEFIYDVKTIITYLSKKYNFAISPEYNVDILNGTSQPKKKGIFGNFI